MPVRMLNAFTCQFLRGGFFIISTELQLLWLCSGCTVVIERSFLSYSNVVQSLGWVYTCSHRYLCIQFTRQESVSGLQWTWFIHLQGGRGPYLGRFLCVLGSESGENSDSNIDLIHKNREKRDAPPPPTPAAVGRGILSKIRKKRFSANSSCFTHVCFKKMD